MVQTTLYNLIIIHQYNIEITSDIESRAKQAINNAP
jgi:hypothetical protein